MAKRYTTETLVEKFKEVHGDYYDYKYVDFKKMLEEVWIGCHKHLYYFKVTPKQHIQLKTGCPECGKENRSKSQRFDWDEVHRQIIEIHGDKFIFYTEYKNMNEPMDAYCKEHNMTFSPMPSSLIYQKSGCMECGNDKKRDLLKTPLYRLIEQFESTHGTKYGYSLIREINSQQDEVNIICYQHGVFSQKAYSHIAGQGCPDCHFDVVSKQMKGIYPDHLKQANEKSFEDAKANFIDDAREIHGESYDYDMNTYAGTFSEMRMICKEHGDFYVSPNRHLYNNTGCPLCFDASEAQTSKIEKKFIEEIKSFYYGTLIANDRTVISPYEIDVILEDHKIGIECNGIYWHHDEKKDRKYHIKKTKLANTAGYKMLQFFDVELYMKPEIVMSVIKSKIGIFEERIFARKCEVRVVEYEIASQFLDDNHMQGGNSVGSVRYGLYHNDELVSLMTFGKPRFNKEHDWELIRFCNKINSTVIGGASKLLKYAINDGLNNIVSYANRRWSDGNLYNQLGFVLVGESEPNYYYAKSYKHLVSRYTAQKHNLPKLLGDKFNPELSEFENMTVNGWLRVYDCGNLVYSFKKK